MALALVASAALGVGYMVAFGVLGTLVIALVLAGICSAAVMLTVIALLCGPEEPDSEPA